MYIINFQDLMWTCIFSLIHDVKKHDILRQKSGEVHSISHSTMTSFQVIVRYHSSLPSLVALVPESPHTSLVWDFLLFWNLLEKRWPNPLGSFFGTSFFEGFFHSKNHGVVVVSVDFSSPKKISPWFSTTKKKQRIALIGKKTTSNKTPVILARKIQLAQFESTWPT